MSWTYSQGAEHFTIQVSNEGVGPAIIETVQLSVDKKPVPDWDGAFDKLFSRLLIPDFPLRLLPPYTSASEAAFERFAGVLRGHFPQWLDEPAN